jgi:two-component system CheB/CheR fusion protein
VAQAKSPKRRKAAASSAGTEPIAIVGIGVCLASLSSLQQLFAGLSNDLGAAYVIAVRQQDGLSGDTVLDALKNHSKLPMKVASGGERIQSEHIYIGGPDDLITITDGHIEVRKAEEPLGHRGTVDTMMMSLSEHAQDHAIAVILSGLGSEGTAGVTATKKYGGLSIAESLDGETEAIEQGAASPAGVVDLLLPIDQIPTQIALYIQGLKTLSTAETTGEIPQGVKDQLTQVATILRNVTANDFHGYKINTFLRRVQRRMQVVQLATIDDYVKRLKKDRDEVHHLFQDLLIGVTQFFRDPAEFDLLEKELPKLFEGKGPEDQFRVWVLGCATGEEAYSIGILIAEYLADVATPPHVQIFATDLDARALGVARAGRYSNTIADQVRPDRLARWFVKEGDTYCIAKELREMCIFSPHNLVKDAPFSRIDLLSCRNLLIYLNADLQDRVIPIFHFSLRPGGILFLGSSENVTRHQKLFAPVDRKHRLFRRVETPTSVLPEFPLSPRVARRDMPSEKSPVPVRPSTLAAGVSRRAGQIAERYAPSYVVIDSEQEVLHFSGRTGGYLEPATGAASLNLLNLVHRDLRLDLRSALHHAAEEKKRVELPRVPIRQNGDSSLVNLIVEPVGESGELTAFVVIFQDAGDAPAAAAAARSGGATDEHVERLESELRLTKDRLQATIEELQTVNAELGHRVSDLARANSDLRNLLESTQIATIFLDNDLRVRSFTPAATDIFHLLESDVGRPIDHLGARVSYPQLSDDVRKVLTKLGTAEREVTSREGAHYIARVHPYRSVDNFIAGAVLTFLDVTSTVRAEAALRESESRLRLLLSELQHRVRNTLGLVKSITTRTAESSRTVDDMATLLAGRLDAFARVQAAVTRNPDQGVDFASLIADELLAHGLKDGETVSLDGPEIRLKPRAAESMSLAVHELATNAIKHGEAGRNGGGRIAITWQVNGGDGDKKLEFEWMEQGSNGDLRKPGRKGFGYELLTRSLPYDLEGSTKLDFSAEGVRFNLEAPIDGLVENGVGEPA